MPIACPNCGSRFLRDSKPRTRAERLARLWMVEPMRCGDCETRFVQRTLIWNDLLFARCPRCLRMDLAKWTGETYEPPFWMSLKCSLGAHRWRCEYCRLNFASFRRRNEVFSFGRWKRMNQKES